MRELKALAGLSRQDHALDEPDARGVNAAGHLVTNETIDALDRWTLDAIQNRPARDVLIVDRDDRPASPMFDARLERLGARVTRVRPGGTSAMLALPHVAKVPEEVLHGIGTWPDGWDVSNHRPTAEPPQVGCCDVAPARNCCSERAVRFGPDGRLFGIVDSPAGNAPVNQAIILLNTGVEYHVGPHRMLRTAGAGVGGARSSGASLRSRRYRRQPCARPRGRQPGLSRPHARGPASRDRVGPPGGAAQPGRSRRRLFWGMARFSGRARRPRR